MTYVLFAQVAFMFAPQSMLEALGASVLVVSLNEIMPSHFPMKAFCDLRCFVMIDCSTESMICVVIFFQWNLFIANQINRERVQSGHLGATFVILLGTGMALHYGPHHSTKYSMHEILDLFTQPSFLAYEAVVVTLVLALQIIYYYETQRVAQSGRKGSYSSFVIQFSYAGVSAGLGANAVLLSKCVAEAVHHWSKGGDHPNMSIAKHIIAPAAIIVAWLTLMSF